MNDRQLQYALAVWRERSFSRAAVKLGVSQPTLSEQVRHLEDELGFILFDRTSRGVEPTNNGRAFLQHADEVLAGLSGLKDLARELKGSPGSTVRVGVVSALARAMIPGIIAAVATGEPHCRLDLITATTRRVQRLVAQERLDVGLVLAGEVTSFSQDLVREPFAETDLVLVLPPEHALGTEPGPIALARISAHPLAVNEPRIGYGKAVLKLFDDEGLEPNVVAVCDDLESIKLMVAARAAIALVPSLSIQSEVAAGTLLARWIVPAHRIPLLFVRRTKPLPARVEHCVAALNQWVRAGRFELLQLPIR